MRHDRTAVRFGLAALGLVAAATASAPAAADPPWRHGWRGPPPRYWGPPPYAYYAPRYVPPPVYYAPPPVYYAPPRVYYPPPPVYVAPGLSFGFSIPLR